MGHFAKIEIGSENLQTIHLFICPVQRYKRFNLHLLCSSKCLQAVNGPSFPFQYTVILLFGALSLSLAIFFFIINRVREKLTRLLRRGLKVSIWWKVFLSCMCYLTIFIKTKAKITKIRTLKENYICELNAALWSKLYWINLYFFTESYWFSLTLIIKTTKIYEIQACNTAINWSAVWHTCRKTSATAHRQNTSTVRNS